MCEANASYLTRSDADGTVTVCTRLRADRRKGRKRRRGKRGTALKQRFTTQSPSHVSGFRGFQRVSTGSKHKAAVCCWGWGMGGGGGGGGKRVHSSHETIPALLLLSSLQSPSSPSSSVLKMPFTPDPSCSPLHTHLGPFIVISFKDALHT